MRPENPSGCLSDLFPWVETSIGAGSNGKPQPSPFTNLTTGEGSTAMAFYNVRQGDAPYMKELADQFTLSDNFHQSFQGGTERITSCSATPMRCGTATAPETH